MTQKVDCDQFQQRIDKILDNRGNLEHDAILKNHSIDCAACCSLLSDYVQFQSVFASSNHADFWSADINAVDEKIALRPDSGERLNRIALMVGTLAAVLLVSISLSISNLNSRGNSNDVITVKANPMPQMIAHMTKDSASPGDSSQTIIPRRYVGDSIQALGTTISNGQISLARYSMKPETISASIDELSQKLHPLNAYYKYSVELPGIRPVQASFSATFDLIQRSLETKSQPPQQPDLGLLRQKEHRSV